MSKTKAKKAYEDAVARLGCIVCRNIFKTYTPAGLHHVRKLATSKKREDAPAIPLCAAHHQYGGYGVAIHSGEETWERNYGSVLGLVAQVDELLKETA